MSEIDLTKICMVEASRLGSRLFRNNVGMGWVGKTFRVSEPKQITMRPGQVLVSDARVLHAGLCEGSSDLIGWQTVVITQEMVGRRVAIFTAVENKIGRGTTSTEQELFIDATKRAGGIAGIIRSVDELKNILRR